MLRFVIISFLFLFSFLTVRRGERYARDIIVLARVRRASRWTADENTCTPRTRILTHVPVVTERLFATCV